MNRKLFLFLFMTILVVGGCTMAPKYTRPDMQIPSEWPTGPAYDETQPAFSVPTTEELTWQDFLPDEGMQEVIEAALSNNRDLRLAALNVEKAQALYGIEWTSLLPSVDATGSWHKERIPADLSSTKSAYTTERYDINLGITSWEIDFFGRIRSLKDKALEEYLATDQSLRSTKILLICTVAQAYLTLAADREALHLVSSTLKTQQAAYELIRKRYEVGIVSELDLRRAQSQVDAARGDVARYTQLVAQDENALNLLVGSPVRHELLSQNLSDIILPKDISAGLSSELLLRRPDVLSAEHRLKAANANIGAARAAFFPRISLTTTAGTASADLSGLFKSGSGV
ncbi:MAG TPA: efflux transporter outer membrane subunit, partial [Smithellaceae bacterium]|nr:efflux transporter outer membrane subunit [Smithellaceae bacterium]